MYEGEVGSFRLTFFELRFERDHRRRLFGEENDPGGVTIDAVNDKRGLAMGRSEMGRDLILEAWFVRLCWERNGQQSSRFVDDDQAGILIEQVEPRVMPFEIPFGRATGAIMPDSDPLPAGNLPRHICRRLLDIVDEDTPTLDGEERFGS
jgi:hypothetical protein